MLCLSAPFQPLCCWVKRTWYWCEDWAGPSISGSRFLICKKGAGKASWLNKSAEQADVLQIDLHSCICLQQRLHGAAVRTVQGWMCSKPCCWASAAPMVRSSCFLYFFFSFLGNYLFLLFAGSGISSWHTSNACGREQEGSSMPCALPLESSERGADVSSQSHSPAVLI